MHSKDPKRYRINTQYDGTRYGGWQSQPNVLSIQDTIESAIYQISGDRLRIFGSSRTDAGVHARNQVFHFDINMNMPPVDFQRALNAVLPSDIRLFGIKRVSPDFNARFDTVSKEYRYLIWNASEVSPFLRLYRHHLRKPLDVSNMERAASFLEGRQDFRSFSANAGEEKKDTIRLLSVCSVKKTGCEICIKVISTGFLYKMVRSISGFLIRVGLGEISPDKTPEILAECKRTRTVPTAPAKGLSLWKIYYE